MFQVGLLMGISWICGFVASAADITLFWWLFVIITSLQGPLLLVSILCSTQFRDVVGKKEGNAKVTNRGKHSGAPRAITSPERPGGSTQPYSKDETQIGRRSMLLKRYDSHKTDDVNEKGEQVSDDAKVGGELKNQKYEEIDYIRSSTSNTANNSIEAAGKQTKDTGSRDAVQSSDEHKF